MPTTASERAASRGANTFQYDFQPVKDIFSGHRKVTIALAKVAQLRAEAGIDPECAVIGIEVSIKAPAAVKRDLLAAHAFVESRTAAPKASRPLRIAADPVKVTSTVTKAKKAYKPAYPHCGSGLQNAPVAPVVQKPVAQMVMLVSMVQLSIVLVESVCADAGESEYIAATEYRKLDRRSSGCIAQAMQGSIAAQQANPNKAVRQYAAHHGISEITRKVAGRVYYHRRCAMAYLATSREA